VQAQGDTAFATNIEDRGGDPIELHRTPRLEFRDTADEGAHGDANCKLGGESPADGELGAGLDHLRCDEFGIVAANPAVRWNADGRRRGQVAHAGEGKEGVASTDVHYIAVAANAREERMLGA